MRTYDYVCFDCRKAVSRSFMFGRPTCACCHKPMRLIRQYNVPRKDDIKGWEALRMNLLPKSSYRVRHDLSSPRRSDPESFYNPDRSWDRRRGWKKSKLLKARNANVVGADAEGL